MASGGSLPTQTIPTIKVGENFRDRLVQPSTHPTIPTKQSYGTIKVGKELWHRDLHGEKGSITRVTCSQAKRRWANGGNQGEPS